MKYAWEGGEGRGGGKRKEREGRRGEDGRKRGSGREGGREEEREWVGGREGREGREGV